jgi:hypothetical protein
MSEHYRHHRISEAIQRYQPADLPKGRFGVRDRETGQLLADADYDNEAMARAKCRLQAAAEIEKLYILDRPTATARIVAIIGEQTDPQWAAELICDFFEGSKR